MRSDSRSLSLYPKLVADSQADKFSNLKILKCFNCLESNYRSVQCRGSNRCGMKSFNRLHHKLVRMPNMEELSTTNTGAHVNVLTVGKTRLCLRMIPVRMLESKRRAILDSDSHPTVFAWCGWLGRIDWYSDPITNIIHKWDGFEGVHVTSVRRHFKERLQIVHRSGPRSRLLITSKRPDCSPKDNYDNGCTWKLRIWAAHHVTILDFWLVPMYQKPKEYWINELKLLENADSADRVVLLCCLSMKSVPEKFISRIQSL